VLDAFYGTEIRMSRDTLDQFIAQGLTFEKIICLINAQPDSKIKVTAISGFEGEISEVCTAGLGSYFLLFESGFFYAGKGGIDRMNDTIQTILKKHGDKISFYRWDPAISNRQAFIDEYWKMEDSGYGKAGVKTYNQRWSPGKRYYFEDLYRR